METETLTGPRLRKRITDSGLTISEAAKITGVSDATIRSLIRMEASPKDATLKKIDMLPTGKYNLLNAKSLGEFLKKYRVMSRINRVEMSARIGMSRWNYSHLERGVASNITQHNFLKVIKYLPLSSEEVSHFGRLYLRSLGVEV